MTNGCLLPWTKIALIINIHAISDRNKAVLPRELLHGSEQLVFAMKATRRIIADIFGLFCFMCLDDLKRNPLLLRESHCIFKLSSSQAGRIGDDGQHIVTQYLVRGISKVRGIHSP